MTDPQWVYAPYDPDRLSKRLMDVLTPYVAKVAKRSRKDGYAQALRDVRSEIAQKRMTFIDPREIDDFAAERGIDLNEQESP